jgi:hypothetical protein
MAEFPGDRTDRIRIFKDLGHLLRKRGDLCRQEPAVRFRHPARAREHEGNKSKDRQLRCKGLRGGDADLRACVNKDAAV